MTNITSSTITLNPTTEILSVVELIEKFFHMFSFLNPTRQDRIAQESQENNMPVRSSKFSKFNFKFPKKNILKIVLPVLILVIVGSIIFSAFNKKANTPTVLSAQDQSDVKTVNIDKTFKFPLKDANGKNIGTFSYVVKSAELRHQIVVKGQTATSVKGRAFLIVNVKILNGLSQGLSINSRDYIRVSVNGDNSEWFAPDIHNDPVEAQAISTTNTRVAIAINDSDENIRLQIGEIGGKKEIVPVNFK